MGEREAVGREAAPDGECDLELLYRDAAPQLWRAIYGFAGGRRHLAEDAVAEAFARALEHQRQIREPNRPANANTANAVTAAATRDGRLGGTGSSRGPSTTRSHRSVGSSARRNFANSVCQRSTIGILLIAQKLAESPPPAEHVDARGRRRHAE